MLFLYFTTVLLYYIVLHISCPIWDLDNLFDIHTSNLIYLIYCTSPIKSIKSNKIYQNNLSIYHLCIYLPIYLPSPTSCGCPGSAGPLGLQRPQAVAMCLPRESLAHQGLLLSPGSIGTAFWNNLAMTKIFMGDSWDIVPTSYDLWVTKIIFKYS